MHREKQRDTHTHTHACTPLLWQEQTFTQSPKPDVIFHVPRPAVNVNYKPYDPKFGNLPNLCVTHDQKGDTCWWRHGICFSIKINITKVEWNIEFWNHWAPSQTRETAPRVSADEIGCSFIHETNKHVFPKEICCWVLLSYKEVQMLLTAGNLFFINCQQQWDCQGPSKEEDKSWIKSYTHIKLRMLGK